MLHRWPLLKGLQVPTFVLLGLGIVVLFFDIQYFVMSNFPGTRNEMCVMGANLTPSNITFAGILSIMIALLVTGFLQLFQQKLNQRKLMATSMSSTVGLFLGVISSFCTICTLPILSLSSLSIGLEFFSEYQAYLKVASIVLLGWALMLLNRQLKNVCQVCVRTNK